MIAKQKDEGTKEKQKKTRARQLSENLNSFKFIKNIGRRTWKM